ncbi:hypothetical protein VitviT2T_028383 [Vitis vinifera]|uniref:Uncharacterized protein n=2 Tax=Vitis vinifera TaxID=29760 RepID=A0ABY9DVQ8_VITVI
MRRSKTYCCWMSPLSPLVRRLLVVYIQLHPLQLLQESNIHFHNTSHGLILETQHTWECQVAMDHMVPLQLAIILARLQQLGTQLLMRKLLHPSSWKIVFASLVSRVRVQQSGLLHQIGTFLTCQQVLSTTSPLRANM